MMVHALTLSIAQRLAWSLTTSLKTPVVLIRVGTSYGVMQASEFDGDPMAVLAEYARSRPYRAESRPGGPLSREAEPPLKLRSPPGALPSRNP